MSEDGIWKDINLPDWWQRDAQNTMFHPSRPWYGFRHRCPPRSETFRFGTGGTAYLYRLTRDVNFLHIEGTNEMKDWLVNTKIEKLDLSREGEPIEMHSGFHTQALALYDRLGYSGFPEKGEKWGITGHSMGGAVAQVLTWLLCNRMGEDTEFYCLTFGSPRVWGKDPPRESVMKCIYNMVNPFDPVTKVPKIGYRHHGLAWPRKESIGGPENHPTDIWVKWWINSVSSRKCWCWSRWRYGPYWRPSSAHALSEYERLFFRDSDFLS